jgi:hypothetical protein
MAEEGTGIKAGIAVLVSLCLLSAGRLALHRQELDYALGRKITLAQYDKRFEGLRRALPDRGVVGYLGESGQYELPNYYLTQYALAPLVVDHSPEHALVVGNFPSSTILPGPRWPADLILLEDFGDGVVLLGKRSQ